MILGSLVLRSGGQKIGHEFYLPKKIPPFPIAFGIEIMHDLLENDLSNGGLILAKNRLHCNQNRD